MQVKIDSKVLFDLIAENVRLAELPLKARENIYTIYVTALKADDNFKIKIREDVVCGTKFIIFDFEAADFCGGEILINNTVICFLTCNYYTTVKIDDKYFEELIAAYLQGADEFDEVIQKYHINVY